MTYIPPPKSLPAFKDAQKVKPKGKRMRWKDEKFIYEWDSLHGKVEKYNKRGKHLGEFDHLSGEQTKEADSSRFIQP